MALLTKKKFDFLSRGLAADTFAVVRFKGSEGFSKCYEFEIDLVSTEAEIDLDQVLKNPATFTIVREEENIPFHGILAEFEQLHQVDAYVFYRAVLVPKLWWLSLTHHNQVFLDKKVPDVLEEVLKDGGLTSLDFELRLKGNYPSWEYICQYRESHLDFVSRWMEREGMYWYFEQREDSEKVIITDTRMAHQEMAQGKTMYYSPPSGLDDLHREEVIRSFVCRQKMLPQTLKVKDYNYRTPSLDLTGSAQVKSDGRGEVYIYGEHFKTPEEGNGLAKIRAEELLCQEKRFYGESTIPYLRHGYLFDLENHYRRDFNQGFLTIELVHEGSQSAFLLAGIQKGLSKVDERPYYRNTFTAIPQSVQFRPERKTEKARFFGTMNARIDAAGSGKYAELDDQGRYKVLLPLDLSGRKNGKGSTWLRMVQPYAGSDHGMHFPLHKGTEVLLTFIDGDPDRPIVQGAVPNPEIPSIVHEGNATGAGFRTASGNQISMQDQEGHERIVIGSGDGKSRIICGAGSDSKVITQSSYQANCADYYMTMSSFGTTIANSFSWSAMSGSLIPQILIRVLKQMSQEVAECDELGHRIGAIEKGKHFKDWTKTQETLLSVTPSILGVLFDAWIMSSLAKHLKRKGLVRSDSEYGKIAQEFTAKFKDKGLMPKWKWLMEHGDYLKLVARAYGFGTAGSYGVALVSHIPEKIGKWEANDFVKGLIDPRCASLIKLNKAAPDVLIASTAGHVDLSGSKGIHLYSGEELHIEALEEATIHAGSSVYIAAGGIGGIEGSPPTGTFSISDDPNKDEGRSMNLELVDSRITLNERAVLVKSNDSVWLRVYQDKTEGDDHIGHIKIDRGILIEEDRKEDKCVIELANKNCRVFLDDDEKMGISLKVRKDKKDVQGLSRVDLKDSSLDLTSKKLNIGANSKVDNEIHIGTEGKTSNLDLAADQVSFTGKNQVKVTGSKIMIG